MIWAGVGAALVTHAAAVRLGNAARQVQAQPRAAARPAPTKTLKEPRLTLGGNARAAVSHRDAGTVPEDAAANEHSGLSAFEGGLLATGIAALTSAAGFGWSALDWSEILSHLGQFFS